MKDIEINNCLDKLDGRGSDEEFEAITKLNTLGEKLPKLLLNKYRNSKKWGERASCVYHAIKYAQKNSDALQLGIEATKDKSKKVRYRACMLLACSQINEAIPALESLLTKPESKEDAEAAIDAINCKNQNYFIDRDHSGKVTLNAK